MELGKVLAKKIQGELETRGEIGDGPEGHDASTRGLINGFKRWGGMI